MNSERRTKIMMVSGVGLFAIALMIMLLFVLPAMQMMGTPSEAQVPGPPRPPGGMMPPMPGAPGMAPGGQGAPPGMGGYPGAPGMGGMPGAPGMGGYPGAPGMGGMPGMPGMGAQMGMAGGLEAEGVKGDPLERSRDNPFAPLGAGALGITPLDQYVTPATRYGPDWSRLPITLRQGFVRPSRPVHPPPAPSPEEIKTLAAGAKLRISSILWLAGAPLATYETPDGQTGTVGPGDVVEDWRVIEIGRDYVVVQNTQNKEMVQRLPLKMED